MKKIEKNRVTEEWFEVVRNNDIKTIKKMLKEGFNVNVDRNGWTALHSSCYYGCIETMKLLLSNGANVNIQTDNLRTPLHVACTYGDIGIAKLLIKHGADVTTKDIDGDNPIDDLKGRNQQQYEELIEWLTEYHPEKMLEYMANDKAQSRGVGL